MPKPKIIVERVPLDYRPVDIAPNFPAMPVLYLELIENKDKVLPELKDKSAQPIFLPEKSPVLQPFNNNLEIVKRDKTPEIYRPPVMPSPRNLSPVAAVSPSKKSSPESMIHSRLKERMKKKSESREKSPIIQDHHSIKERRQEEEWDRKKNRESYREPPVNRDELPREERPRDSFRADDYHREERPRDSFRADDYHREERPRDSFRADDYHREERPRDSFKADDYHRDERQRDERRRDEGQRDERQRDERAQAPVELVREKSSTPKTREIRDILGGVKSAAAAAPVLQNNANLPPTLEQITSSEPIKVQGKQVKDITYTAQDEVERRRDLMFRFDILKKSYKDAHIPEISQFMDLETLDRMYQDTVRRVALDSKVDGYRRFLNMGFMGIELLFSNVLKIDMTGFAKQQMASMNSYEKILIELGEKSMLEKSKSQWPAEVRLLFTIVMNAVIFVMSKAIMGGGLSKIFGGGGGGGGGGMGAIGGLMSGLMGAMGGGGMPAPQGPQPQAPQVPQEPVPEAPPRATGRRMRGPSTINLDDLGSKKTN